MPQVQCAVALLVRNSFALNFDRLREAIVPYAGSAQTDRAITFAGFRRFFPQKESDPPAVTTSLMFGHPRCVSRQ